MSGHNLQQQLAAVDALLAVLKTMDCVECDTTYADHAYPFGHRTLATVMADVTRWRVALEAGDRRVCRYTVDGDEVEWRVLVSGDMDIPTDQLVRAAHLRPGESMNIGGGASASVLLRRES